MHTVGVRTVDVSSAMACGTSQRRPLLSAASRAPGSAQPLRVYVIDVQTARSVLVSICYKYVIRKVPLTISARLYEASAAGLILVTSRAAVNRLGGLGHLRVVLVNLL